MSCLNDGKLFNWQTFKWTLFLTALISPEACDLLISSPPYKIKFSVTNFKMVNNLQNSVFERRHNITAQAESWKLPRPLLPFPQSVQGHTGSDGIRKIDPYLVHQLLFCVCCCCGINNSRRAALCWLMVSGYSGHHDGECMHWKPREAACLQQTGNQEWNWK